MRIKSKIGEHSLPKINPAEVERFFSIRAEKAKKIGSLRAVIYQDKHPDLAERRDIAEKALLLPKLALHEHSCVLDIGCGTGRWTGVLAPLVQSYHGTDFAPGLIDIARAENREAKNVRYSVLHSTSVRLDSLGESQGFDRIIVLGLLIYLNEEDVLKTLRCIADVAAMECRLMIREPVAIGERLTIKEHFSSDLDQFYNAIYRTESELLLMISEILGQAGFTILDSGYVFEHPENNNRADTVQKWFLMERKRGY